MTFDQRKMLAQQARIEQLKYLIAKWERAETNDAIQEAEAALINGSLGTHDDLSALRAHDAELTAKHIEICKKLAAENEGLAGEVWCERCADAIEKGCV